MDDDWGYPCFRKPPNGHQFYPCTNHDTQRFSQPFSRQATHVACRPIGVRDAIARRPRCKPQPFARPSESFQASPVFWRGMVNLDPGDTEPGRFDGIRRVEFHANELGVWGLNTGTHSIRRTAPQARGSSRNRKQEKTYPQSENLGTSPS